MNRKLMFENHSEQNEQLRWKHFAQKPVGLLLCVDEHCCTFGDDSFQILRIFFVHFDHLVDQITLSKFAFGQVQ